MYRRSWAHPSCCSARTAPTSARFAPDEDRPVLIRRDRRPACGWTSRCWAAPGARTGGGRRGDELLVAGIKQAWTAFRPLRVQAVQPDLVEPVDHLPDGVLVRGDQPGNDRHGIPPGRGQDHHCPPPQDDLAALFRFPAAHDPPQPFSLRLKCLYLATRELDPTGKGRASWATRWKLALNAFAFPLRRKNQLMPTVDPPLNGLCRAFGGGAARRGLVRASGLLMMGHG
ncbi:hypothetical protein QF047_002378 [Arthrobacter sp. W4I7]|nr:hypothetical protein [Arthrobacter sp. W4I7]